MIYERRGFGDGLAQMRCLYELLFEPGAQLMHVDESPWTEVEAQAVVGLKILRALESIVCGMDHDSNWLIRTAFEEQEEFFDAARRLIVLLGYEERVLMRIARLLAYLRSRFALDDGRWQCSDEALSGYFRLAYGVDSDFRNWTFKLAEFLSGHSAQLRGSDCSKLRLSEALVWPYGSAVARTMAPRELCTDWNAGSSSQAIFLMLPAAVAELWSRRPGVRNFGGHLGVPLITEIDRMDPRNLDDFIAAMKWVLLNPRSWCPRLVCQTPVDFDELLVDAERLGGEVALKDLRVSSRGVCHALAFHENSRSNPKDVGMPAVIAARHEGVMPWLLLSLVDNPNFWFLEVSADWDCVGIEGVELLCKPRHEAAILAAFSRLGTNENIAFGALSGRIDEQQLRTALRIRERAGTDAVLKRARRAPWAYGHEWGGGSDEHFSIFCAQDPVLSGLIADHLGKGNFSWL